MAPKQTRPSRTSQTSEDRVNAAWERGVQQKVGDTELTLGELEFLLFLDRNFSSKTNDLQSQINTLTEAVSLLVGQHNEEIQRQILEANRRVAMLHNSIEELKRSINELDNKTLSHTVEEIKRRLDELENTTWLLPLH